ncbi:TPA: hypothetical protein QDA74_001366 [Burkholderia territorii]|uniref:hypothetical protein n=1 Tax=Burkholderia territorii TaxID=1503055 RepID=UPI0011C99444|nr:hypothetical protein [Burkholderia territorii]TXG30163.1 hypothetical protein FU139_00425 [Burkholderia territorii]HDR8858927.1 hypothetical protein [Burkholderia territorii]HDR8864284.1 hypothetical protein [Burkholderia territorii]HDR8872851.1 hypothetical protein [Burkholderia territorii]HDR8875918.1 hypothetical protein [Burkholderia territorii]
MDTTQTAQGISTGSSIENAVMVQAIAALANRWRLRDCAQPGNVRRGRGGTAEARVTAQLGRSAEKIDQMNRPYHSDGLRVKSEPAIIRPIHFSDRFVRSPARGIHHAFSHRI